MKKPPAIPEPQQTPDSPGDGPHPLAAAKDRARRRIDHDRRRYPEMEPVLAAIAADLFTPGWKAEAVEGAAYRRFRVTLGITPGTYRDRQVLETAVELVRESTLPILEIAAGLGFDDPELFTKWFKWRTEEAPTTMRSAADDPDPGPTADQTADWPDPDWRKAAAWDESPQRGGAMIRKIRELYPALDHHPPSD